MKFNLTINDLTLNEAQEILAKIGGNVTTTISGPAPALPAAPVPPFPAAEENTAGNLPPVTGNVGETDVEGLPWDARIHSSSKKKNADGRWAKRKNTDENTYNSVVAELRARGNGGNPVAPVSGGSIPPMPGAVPPAPMMPAAPQYNAPPLPPAMPPAAPAYNTPPAPPAMPAAPAYAPPPAAPAAPVQQPQPASQSISDLFNKIQQMFQSGSADANYINSLTSRLSQRFSVQVTSINDIAGRPDMIADAFNLIAADGK